MNLAQQINAVTRRVAQDGTDHVVTLEQTLRTTPYDAWDACTNPERLGRWFEPVEGDLGLGGRYRLTESGTHGTIEVCDSPGRSASPGRMATTRARSTSRSLPTARTPPSSSGTPSPTTTTGRPMALRRPAWAGTARCSRCP